MKRLVFLSLIGFILAGCGTETSLIIEMKSKPYATPSPDVTATLCIKRIRFKTSASATGSQVVLAQFTPKLFTLNSYGDTLGYVTLPVHGGFGRVELDLEKDCTGSTTPAVDGIVTTPDTFTTDLATTLVFESSTAFRSFDKKSLEIDFQNIATAMSTLDSTSTPSAVRTALQAVSGTF
jgi:hypothetical protein